MGPASPQPPIGSSPDSLAQIRKDPWTLHCNQAARPQVGTWPQILANPMSSGLPKWAKPIRYPFTEMEIKQLGMGVPGERYS